MAETGGRVMEQLEKPQGQGWYWRRAIGRCCLGRRQRKLVLTYPLRHQSAGLRRKGHERLYAGEELIEKSQPGSKQGTRAVQVGSMQQDDTRKVQSCAHARERVQRMAHRVQRDRQRLVQFFRQLVPRSSCRESRPQPVAHIQPKTVIQQAADSSHRTQRSKPLILCSTVIQPI